MINLNTGKQEFVLNFDGEHTEKIYFNPCDPALMVRIRDFSRNSKEQIKELGNVELDEKGNPVGESVAESFKKMLDIIYTELDKAFGSEISATVFKYCSPFAKVGKGDYFFATFIEAIVPEINKRIEESKSNEEKKREKYIGKYTK